MENEIKEILHSIEKLTYEVERLRRSIESQSGLAPRFIESSPSVRTYRSEVEEIINPPHDIEPTELYVMGYFDQEVIDRLERRAHSVKIISPENALQNKKNKFALTRIAKAGAEVRTHPMLHARIFCAPKWNVLIVGSGDLQSDCFSGNRFDAGILSNYPELIKSAMDFFNRVWEESKPLELL